jgi:hypothetical protein
MTTEITEATSFICVATLLVVPQLAVLTNNTQRFSNLLPKEDIITSSAYNIGDFGG